MSKENDMSRFETSERDPLWGIEAQDLYRTEKFLQGVYEGETSFPGSPVAKGLVKMNMDHSKRVERNAEEIAKGEGLSILLLRLAALLHDVHKLDHTEKSSGGIDTWHHHHRGASLAQKYILTDLKKSAALADKVQNMIDRHSAIPFIDRYWRKNYGRGVPSPETAEDIALRDADTLDQLGIGGMFKIVNNRQAPGSTFYQEDGGDIQKAIASARKSFEEASSVIMTATGKKMAEKYTKEGEEFFRRVANVKTLDEFSEIYRQMENELLGGTV